MNLSRLEKDELIALYGDVIQQLRQRRVIRTKNVVGDIGEYLAIDYYSKTPGLPRLQPAPPSTKNIDAISTRGERYTIKSTTGNVTSAFYGLNPPDSGQEQRQLFEYVILVMLNDRYQLEKILELDWAAFLAHKKWHRRMHAWHLVVGKKLLTDAIVRFDAGHPAAQRVR